MRRREFLAFLVVPTLCLVAVWNVHGAQGTYLRASHAASVLSAGTPWFLFVGRGEVRVPLHLRNEGTETWDPVRQFRVSYRWLTSGLFQARAPIDIEGLRTELPKAVAPGESVVVEARIAPPEDAGLYALQWDPVQEGVTWFSARDPAPPSAVLLVVLPPRLALVTPLPAIAAIIFWIILRRRRRAEAENAGRPADWGGLRALDALWCASFLFVSQAVLLAETRLSTDGPVLGWSLLVAAGLPALALIFLHHRIRSWLLWLLALVGSVVVLGDLIYFRYFGDITSASVLIATGEGTYVGESIASLLAARDVWFVLSLVAAIPLVWELSRPRGAYALSRTGIFGRAVAAVLLAVPATIAAVKLSATPAGAPGMPDGGFSNLAVVQSLGPFGYHMYDAWGYLRSTWGRQPLRDEQRDEVRAWFAERASTRAGVGPLFGAARKRNLLVVQAEALQAFVIGLRVNGQEVTPHLNRWREEALSFSNVWDQTGEGRTSDAEFLSLASLLPLDHGAVSHQYPGNHFVGLPRVLASHGYTTLSAVPFGVEFWNRRAMHSAYGFARSLFVDDFAPGEVIGWGLNDRDFLQQMVPKLQDVPQPFMAWLITLSLHHPFTSFPDRHKVLDVGEQTDPSFGNYLHAMRFLDEAMGDLHEGLVRAGLADNTVVVVFGDHDAGFARERPLARAIGIPTDEIDWRLQDRVPWLIRVPGTNPPRGQIATEAGQIDMAPTLLALLGVDPASLPYMGRNLLGSPGNGVIVRPYGGWVAAPLFFDAGARQSERCYDIITRVNVSLDRCREGTAHSARAREMSKRVLTYDLQANLAK